jgi:hypothetical protein
MCLPLANLDSRTLAQGEHCGFMWQIVPNRMGYRCGYIRVLPGHPWFGQPYQDLDVECHGGLTFGEPGTACPTHGPEAEYWYGFDCAHGGDAEDLNLLSLKDLKRKIQFAEEFTAEYPEYGEPRMRESRETVKDTEYVRNECRSLCEQAQAAMSAAA